jgi:hypothetical protein
MHVGQLLQLYKMTGFTAFARAADQFQSDYPNPAVTGALQVEPGTYTAMRFDAADGVIARRTITVRRATSWGVRLRQRHHGRSAIDLCVAGSSYDGWWLAERPGRVFLRGFAAPLSYEPTRRLAIAAGQRCTALDFREDGSVRDSVRMESGDGLTLAVGRRAVVNGKERVRVSEGELDGYWLPLRRGFVLR